MSNIRRFLHSVQTDFLNGVIASSLWMMAGGFVFAVSQGSLWFELGSILMVACGLISAPEFRKQTKIKGSLKKPPGTILLTISEFVLPKKLYERACVAAVIDMREEYNDALFQNRIWKARWVRIRGTWSFFAAIGLDRAFAFVSFFVKAWKSVN